VFDLSGHRALVTGAGRGVGAGVAELLARQGAAVAVNDLVPERAAGTAARIVSAGGAAVDVAFDVSDLDAVEQGVADAADRLGGHVDILVNNAGVPDEMPLAAFRDLTPEQWRRFVDLNLYGSLHCTRSVLDPMVDGGWGRIVQISSSAARTGLAFGVSLYGASKSGIEGFVRHLSQEVARSGITVNALALGLMWNALPEGSDESVVSPMARSIPVGRLGTPEDAGAAVLYLVSEEASWCTGQIIDLNGGATTS
jgi:3-oxoacyl-[acyl-carrier protein] reductase